MQSQQFTQSAYYHHDTNNHLYQVYKADNDAVTDLAKFNACSQSDVFRAEISNGRFERTKPTSELHDTLLGGNSLFAVNNDSGL